MGRRASARGRFGPQVGALSSMQPLAEGRLVGSMASILTSRLSSASEAIGHASDARLSTSASLAAPSISRKPPQIFETSFCAASSAHAISSLIGGESTRQMTESWSCRCRLLWSSSKENGMQ